MSLQEQVLNQIRAEFGETPDMKLTLEEIQRQCELPRSLCAAARESLVQLHFLRVTSDRRYNADFHDNWQCAIVVVAIEREPRMIV
jgi:DNA-binding IclR family transcriptional regulator